MRERLARLQTAERAAASGDFVVIDYLGSMAAGESSEAPAAWEPFAGGEGRDQLVELGSGNLIPGFEEALIGASAGETRTVALTFPADYGNTELAGRDASFEVDRQGGQAQGAARRSMRTSRSTPASTTWQELREDIHARLLEAEQGTRRGRVPPGGARRRRGRREGRGDTRARQRPRARDVGADAALALAPRHHARDLPADRRSRGAGDPHRDGARSRARAAS